MSLFQCEHCGCAENTALSAQGFRMMRRIFDWSYASEREGLLLCSACGPSNYNDGSRTGFGSWHGEFRRVFLPLGMFRTNERGDLEHKESGDTDFESYEISEKPTDMMSQK